MSSLRTIGFLGSHSPRQCGIATFTADLSQAVQALDPALNCTVVAMNDGENHYHYPEQVHYQIPEQNLSAYGQAADFLNLSATNVLSVQHEYGIFGGSAGAHLLTLLRQVRMPIVTTLHTVIANPTPEQRAVMDELCTLSKRIVVMSTTGRQLLNQVHRVPYAKIDLIHHGAPDLPDCAQSKARLGLVGKRVVLTFGLLSPDKGIEYVINALATVRERYPDVLYVVVGATHPHVKALHGESYRAMLCELAQGLGVTQQLRFYDGFASQPELLQFLAAADIFVTPYLNVEQTTSGALAYAVGAGKAIVSSEYSYAKEMLGDGRGRLVPPRDSQGIAAAVSELFEDSEAKVDVEERTLAFGKNLRWPIIAAAYLETFENALRSFSSRSKSGTRSAKRSQAPRPQAPRSQARLMLPGVNLSHLQTLTDDTGVLQHATYGVPRYDHGYCLDDNARALLVMLRVEDERAKLETSPHSLTTRYLAFVLHAFNGQTGRFRNFMNYDRRWAESLGSEDSQGRALWAIGTVSARSRSREYRALARTLFEDALPAIVTTQSPRAWAYALLGVAEYIESYGGDGFVAGIGRELATRLWKLFPDSFQASDDDWPWCEDRVTYANARICQALMVSGRWMGHAPTTTTGLRALKWLCALQTDADGLFAPVGSNGFLERGGQKANFDQQPIEACSTVSACLVAHEITHEERWNRRAKQAFSWFTGRNQLGETVYDARTGGCRDGLHPQRVNQNQGAESTLSFLLALLDMRRNLQIVVPADSRIRVPDRVRSTVLS